MKPFILGLIILGVPVCGFGQDNPCDNPYPDSCQYPDTCCAIPTIDCPFVPGDFNGNGQFNGLDIVYLVNYFKGGSIIPGIYSSYDVNCDCKVNGLDIVYMVRFLRGLGQEPKCCLYQCQAHPFSGTIGDYIWFDEDRDGIQDTTEVGQPFMLVDLYDCADPPNLLGRDTTDSGGHYSFEGLSAGNYRVRLQHSDDFYYSPKDRGDNDEIDSDADSLWGITDCIALGQDITDNRWDIGYYTPRNAGDIGDFIWNDLNRNGIQDNGEPGLPEIALDIYRRPDSLLVQSAFTDSTGHYFFADLPQGYYYIMITAPPGFAFSPKDQGGNDSLDSDVDPATGIMTGDELYEGETDLTWDAGLYWPDTSLGCTRSTGYWKNHAGFGPQEDMVTPLLPIWLGNPDSSSSLNVTTAQIAYDILLQRVYGVSSNGITKLYAQLLAAKLNIAAGASPDDVADAIEDADTFLSMNSWEEWDSLTGEERQLVLRLKDVCDGYNNGFIGPGQCDEIDYQY